MPERPTHHEFTGRVASDTWYYALPDGRTYAEFHLQTENQRHYNIWATNTKDGNLADRVRDTVREGQTEMTVFALGPFDWQTSREETKIGYVADMVAVPEDQKPTIQVYVAKNGYKRRKLV